MTLDRARLVSRSTVLPPIAFKVAAADLVPGFVYTNATVAPSLVLGLVMWLCPMAWFFALSLRLWNARLEADAQA